MAAGALTETGWPAQEPCRAPSGMVASVNPLASAAGLKVLQEGGNAVDAAVAMGAVLAVVEPWSGQLGGDAFLLIHEPLSRRFVAINGSGAAPAAATLAGYQKAGGIPEVGWAAATVPGTVDAWRIALASHGSRPLASLLEAAIRHAEDGFPITARQSRSIRGMADVIARFPESRAIFLPGGNIPGPGDRLVQRDLGGTLRQLRDQGLESFYRGELATRLVAASQRAGGLLAARDLAEHRTIVSEPIQVPYRGWTVVQQPPVSQGIVVLMALRILEQFGAPSKPDADWLHLQIEAHKLALAERLEHLGDPEIAPLPMTSLLSTDRARELAGRIDRHRAARVGAAPERPDTTYLCVVDRNRTVVSYIHSLYGGNGVVAGDTGVLLNNRMLGFSLDPSSPNCLAPGKRPIHTLNSWILVRDGRIRFVGGTPGAFWQVQTNLQVIGNLVDFGQDARTAVDAPRWTMGSQTGAKDAGLALEGRLGDTVRGELAGRGHQAVLVGDWAAGGATQIIGVQDDGSLEGAGDPRPGTSSVIGY